ncbi:hypothetical protein Tco_1364870 [Tanacetum coccineum]
MDDEGKPSEKVAYLGDHDSENEVELVDNKMTSFLASERVGYVYRENPFKNSGCGGGQKSLYEKWKEDHYEDSYDKDEFDDPGLTPAQMQLADAFDISLRGQLK